MRNRWVSASLMLLFSPFALYLIYCGYWTLRAHCFHPRTPIALFDAPGYLTFAPGYHIGGEVGKYRMDAPAHELGEDMWVFEPKTGKLRCMFVRSEDLPGKPENWDPVHKNFWVEDEGRIFRANYSGAGRKLIGRGVAPALSGAGSVAYLSPNAGGKIVVVRHDGTRIKTFRGFGGFIEGMVWSPDSQWLAYNYTLSFLQNAKDSLSTGLGVVNIDEGVHYRIVPGNIKGVIFDGVYGVQWLDRNPRG